MAKATTGKTSSAAVPIERATLNVPANALSFLVPAKHAVRLTEFWVNPACVYTQLLEISRYIQFPAGDYREVLVPSHVVKGKGTNKVARFEAEAYMHPALFVVRAAHMRQLGGKDVLYGSFPVHFSREGDTFKLEFEDVGAPPTDIRLAFQLVKPGKAKAK